MFYLCYLCSSLPPVVCRRARVLFTLFVFVFTSSCLPSYKHLEVKTNPISFICGKPSSMLNGGGNAFKSIWSTGPFRHYKCQMYLIFFNHDSSNTFFLDTVRLKLKDSAHRPQ
jgi:hypothetical protein